MKKIIAAFDGLKFNEAAMKYAVSAATDASAHLTGIFLEDFMYHSFHLYDLVSDKGFSQAKLKRLEEQDRTLRKLSVEKFEKFCSSNGLQFSVHHDKSTAVNEILHESIYADLLVINRNENLSHYDEPQPSRFMRELLVNMHCPVLLTPDKFKPLKKIYLLYDGKPSSVHAVKMFSYMFDGLKQLNTEVITVKGMEDNLHIPDNRLFKEFMKRHFPKAKYKVLQGFAEEEIVRYLKDKNEDSMVVVGAYQRGSVSRWFRQSMADVLMKELNMPLFIAHSK